MTYFYMADKSYLSMANIQIKQKGDAVLTVVVILLLITLGFFGLIKLTKVNLFAAGALGGHEQAKQVADVAMRRTMLDIEAAADGLPLEVLPTSDAPWFSTAVPTTSNDRYRSNFSYDKTYWQSCVNNADTTKRCERISYDDFYIYRVVSSTGIIDTSSSNPCYPSARIYYRIVLHTVEKGAVNATTNVDTGNGTKVDTETIYWRCSV